VESLPRFFRGDDQWNAIVEQLKLTPCPHCHAIGFLVRHGALYGFDDSSPQRQSLRARRIFCSNRHKRLGCGRTFSVWLTDRIRRLSLTAGALGAFLQRLLTGSLRAAIRAAPCHLCHRTWQRICQRFHLAQSRIRTALLGLCPPPEVSPDATRRPLAAQVLAHLDAAFPNDPCPIAAFQQTLGLFFV
jgi:hypothetical protein